MAHPIAEQYRQAMANGDTMTAASLLVDAHSGVYNSDLIDQIHQVGRMTRAQLLAPVPGSDNDEPVDRNEIARVKVVTRVFGRRS